jgi:hypothetical protein
LTFLQAALQPRLGQLPIRTPRRKSTQAMCEAPQLWPNRVPRCAGWPLPAWRCLQLHTQRV